MIACILDRMMHVCMFFIFYRLKECVYFEVSSHCKHSERRVHLVAQNPSLFPELETRRAYLLQKLGIRLLVRIRQLL